MHPVPCTPLLKYEFRVLLALLLNYTHLLAVLALFCSSGDVRVTIRCASDPLILCDFEDRRLWFMSGWYQDFPRQVKLLAHLQEIRDLQSMLPWLSIAPHLNCFSLWIYETLFSSQTTHDNGKFCCEWGINARRRFPWTSQYFGYERISCEYTSQVSHSPLTKS